MFPSKTHEPKIGLYLVNDNEEIAFRFFPDLPRGVNFDSVRLEDVNDDGLNDTVVCNQHLINLLERYISGEVNEDRIIEWVNTVWFSDVFDYCEEG